MPTKAPGQFVTLKKRSEFLRIRGGARVGFAAFLMEARPRLRRSAIGAKPADQHRDVDRAQDGSAMPVHEDVAIGGARFGFTVTKKIGNAVVRNRIRRRLREALGRVAPTCARPGCDYVLIARPAALSQQFSELCRDLKKAFQRIDSALDTPSKRGKGLSRRSAS